ncbi:NMDA receptor synaptonuclear signaling and neuronal migration factor isoform X2 [Syngnathoides biaculeatus]|uniref:NMDA receptor synaptonuclear signaling and neuronal migration factor isoform X2 n=2 Tax=Syngnathoides biaculeatus TaxID=300417 RepID=UPI002ADE7439|nr:NMDA receptor synaptonuclear signaling and neuronal migration factor isoform X2 [Syngnathoides biaculeatus]
MGLNHCSNKSYFLFCPHFSDALQAQGEGWQAMKLRQRTTKRAKERLDILSTDLSIADARGLSFAAGIRRLRGKVQMRGERTSLALHFPASIPLKGAARAFGEYLSHTHPDSRNGSALLLCETSVGPDPESPTGTTGPDGNHLHLCSDHTKDSKDSPEDVVVKTCLALHHQPPPPSITVSSKPVRLSLERSFSVEEDQQKGVECTLQPARVYTITTQHGMLMSGGRGSKESLELDVFKEKSGSGGVGPKGGSVGAHTTLIQPSTSPSSSTSSPTQYHQTGSGRGTGTHHHHGNHHHHHAGPSSSGGACGPSGQSANVSGSHSHHAAHHHSHHHHHLAQPPLQTSVSAHNIRGWGDGGKGDAECGGLACESCGAVPSRSQGSLDLESASREPGKQRRGLERMWSVDRMTGLVRDDANWFPKENMFTFQTATTTMQAAFRGFGPRKRREREQDSAEVNQRNFRKHLRMVGSRRMKAQTFAERRSKSFSRSWSDPTPVKTDSPHEPRDSGDLQTSCGTLDEGGVDEAADWEEEREMERLACEGDDFIPPKIMLISSKVPKAEYVPTIIRRDDPSIIPILYDHEHTTFDDILEEIEKKLTAYRRGSKFWRMLIFCQGGPGHLYLLKNKVATFAKVEKEEDMSQFWRRLSRMMSKVNPEPNLIHIMGCYVLGNPNGEKLFQKLKNLMRPYSVEFESPLELSAQGKEMIEMYFDFRLYRLWKTRQHSKLLDYEDLL